MKTAKRNTTPTEAQEQKTVAAYLDAKRVLWCHIPNASGTYGGRMDGARIGKMTRLKAMGQKKGAPDILVFTPPAKFPLARGAAIELKRQVGGTVSSDQLHWLANLAALGWKTAICKGAKEAIDTLKEWGY